METKRDADRRSGTWLTCWECGDWYGPLSETVKRGGLPGDLPFNRGRSTARLAAKNLASVPKMRGGSYE